MENDVHTKALNELLHQISSLAATSEFHLDVSSVIVALGGINKVVQLCLTHPDSSPNSNLQYFEGAVSSLKKIINKQNTNNQSVESINTKHENNKNIEQIGSKSVSAMHNQQDSPDFKSVMSLNSFCSDCDINADAFEIADSPNIVVFDSNNTNQDEKTSIDSRIQDIIINYDENKSNPHVQVNSNHDQTSNTKNIVLVQTLGQFYKASIVFCPDCRNSIYYKYLSDFRANQCFKLVIYNKYYSIAMTCLAVALYVASEISNLWLRQFRDINGDNRSTSYLTLRWMEASVIVFYATTVIATMNFDMIKLICNTFDFWFKIWNTVIHVICFIWINIQTSSRPLLDLIVLATPFVITAVCFAMADSVPLKYKIKKFILSTWTFMYSFNMIRVYFSYQDVYYNPFEKYNFKYSQVSLKSMFMGSYVNIILFVSKPLVADAYYLLLAKCTGHSNSNSNNADNSGTQHERLLTIHKRPKVKWNVENVLLQGTDNEIVAKDIVIMA